MGESEQRLRASMAEALREQADRLTAKWVDGLAARRDVDVRDALPTEELLDHIPGCLRAIADYVESTRHDFPADLVRDEMSALVQRRRHDHGAGVGELMAEYEELASILQDWLEQTIAGVGYDVEPRIVAAVIGDFKDSFARFGVETARAHRAWTAREARDRVLQVTGFADMLRHELRNQLGSAQTATELLVEDGVDPARRERLADLIMRSVQQALDTVDIVKQIMSEDVESRDATTWLPLTDLVNVALGDRAQAEPRVEVDPAQVPELRVPGLRVSMVLMNLLDNAYRYHDEAKADRWVKIETEELRGDDGARWVRITVSDNGRGIEPALQDSVFKFSVRGGPAESGSGLGLALSRDIVSQLGGRIELDSEPRSGTRISFTVPARSA